MTKPDALALADRIETATANVDLAGLVRIEISSYALDQAAAELRRLHAEVEALKKAQALLQQHHATAWNRGHAMGMMANRQIASEAMKAVAKDAWGNTQLTEALMAAEAEVEALRKYKAAAHLIAEDAGRFQWMKDHALAIDTVADPDNQVQIWHGTDPALCTYGKTLSEAVDAAMKGANHG